MVRGYGEEAIRPKAFSGIKTPVHDSAREQHRVIAVIVARTSLSASDLCRFGVKDAWGVIPIGFEHKTGDQSEPEHTH